MGKKLFQGSTVDECIKIALAELNISKDNLKYEIIEEKKDFSRKRQSLKLKLKKKIQL